MRTSFLILVLGVTLAACGVGIHTDADRMASPLFSSLTIIGTPAADGESPVTLRVSIRNYYNEPMAGWTPRLVVSGFRNTVVQNCTETDADGISTCSQALASGYAETKLVSLSDPPLDRIGTVTFIPNERGYNPRPCGFDLNRNGITGEAADCRVCDGVTSDPDGDGINEDLIYVDAANGSDSAGTGAPTAPYRTIAAALLAADGPGDAAEDILCLAGTFHESVILRQSGLAGTYVVDSFVYPRHPFMIVGWDKDRDGIYPPLDPDDTAVVDGEKTRDWAFNNEPNQTSRFEIAHLTVKNFEDPPALTGGGLIYIDSPGGATREHIHLHDLEVESINDGMVDNDVNYDRLIINSQSTLGIMNYAAVRNCQFRKVGGTFATFNRNSNDWTGFLLESNSIFVNTGPNDADFIFTRGIVGTRIEKNDVRADLSAGWDLSSGRFTAFSASACTKNATVRDNSFVGFGPALNIWLLNYACAPSATVDDIVFDRNTVETVFTTQNVVGVFGANISGGPPTLTNTTEDITVTNNFFYAPPGKAINIWLLSLAGNNSGANPGTITFVGNTCIGTAIDSALHLSPGGHTFAHQNYIVQNNLVILDGVYFLRTFLAPSGWSANGNIYSGTSAWIWNGSTAATFAAWQAASGADTNSKQCTPTFVDAANNDYHLAPTDSCARDAGVNITAIAPLDIDGDARSATSPDVGADEVP